MRGWRLAFVPLLLASCGGDGADPPDAGSDGGGQACPGAELRLGTGVREYEPVSDGDTVYLYRGPQGGYMVYLSVQARGLDPSDDRVCYTETFALGGVEFGTGCWRVRLGKDVGEGWFERIGIWGQVDTSYWTQPAAIRGRDAHIHVTVTDKNGCTVDGGWAVHIASEPGV